MKSVNLIPVLLSMLLFNLLKAQIFEIPDLMNAKPNSGKIAVIIIDKKLI